jgi:hypothetical protein
MITRDDMKALLLEAAPPLEEAFKGVPVAWDLQGNMQVEDVLRDVARACIALLERHQAEPLRAVFRVFERLCLEGDPFVRETAVVGIVRYLRSDRDHTITSPEELRPFMGPEVRSLWKGLAKPWQGLG